MDRTNLIKRCQLGDSESFGELYRLYSHHALGTAYLIAGHKGIAEDIMQEAFVQCFRDIKKLMQPETFDVWFYKILVRTGWRMASKYNKFVPVEDVDREVSGSSPDTREASETGLMVQAALEKLSVPLKTVIVLHYFNDLTVKQISDILGCFQGTIKSRLHKARRLLARELGENTGEETEKVIFNGKECKING